MTIELLNARDFDGLDLGVGHKDAAVLDKLNETIAVANSTEADLATLDGVVPRVVRLAMSDLDAGEHSLGALHATKACKVLDVDLDIATPESSGTTTVDIGLGASAAVLGDDLSVAAAGKVNTSATMPVWGDAADEVTYTVPAGGWTEFVGDLLVTFLVDPD